jgi:hypothetical protein
VLGVEHIDGVSAEEMTEYYRASFDGCLGPQASFGADWERSSLAIAERRGPNATAGTRNHVQTLLWSKKIMTHVAEKNHGG